MATIHIPEAEAARNFAAVMAHVRAGAEVVIEGDGSSPVIVRTADERPLRRLSESLRLAREYGSAVTLDGDFARDLEDAIASHPEALNRGFRQV
jgi:hypothetical protein